MISHLLIIFKHIFSSFSTCSIINKAFLFLCWDGEAGVSISFIGKWEWKGNKRRRWEGKGNKRGKWEGKEIREGNERKKGNKRKGK